LIRLVLIRLILVALPILVWLIWAEISRRRGKAMGSTPWAWLVVAGLLLFAGSFIATGLFGSRLDPDATYVPVEIGPDGTVVPGQRPGQE
jgi:uncharacterized membrane protein YgdD (TMEM256/DUF423 family)